MADTANFSHFDIDRYLNNKMTRQEMHDFEKAMMEDPFLADALEGFSKSDQSVAAVHLEEIERKLTIKEEKAKVVAMPVRRFAWWKIAAIVLVIAGAGTISYKLYDTSAEPMQVAVNKTIATPLPQADTISSIEKKFEAPRLFPKREEEFIVKSGSPSSREAQQNAGGLTYAQAAPAIRDTAAMEKGDLDLTALQNNDAKTEMARMPASSAKAKAAGDRLAGRVAGLSLQQRAFKGRVMDIAGEPLPFATIHGENNVGAVADANGDFELKASDSILDVSVVALGYATTRATLKSNPTNNKVLVHEKEELNLAEVVVTTLGKKKKDSASFMNRNVINNEKAGIAPVNGWKQFQQYLFENLQQIKDTSDTYLSGDVVLEFDIDSEGTPSKIKVSESIDELYTLKAIELLKNGPKWKRSGRKNKGKVVVSF